MSTDRGMPADNDAEQRWVLNPDRRTLRFHLPPLPMGGRAEPLKVHLDFDAESIDEIIARLSRLRLQMLPPPSRS